MQMTNSGTAPSYKIIRSFTDFIITVVIILQKYFCTPPGAIMLQPINAYPEFPTGTHMFVQHKLLVQMTINYFLVDY
ncbi:hypothetical protein Y032_0045g1246 [Ancylostoma ceylanicum]|uniref:Uncharacterized protein n=1 Tax=Ancylostoma ceylanicum TaxID=53326 RepID=A0A016UEQ3_9BILA|nr:hypothetical protein Y032_0045g1246 [Ancylostoma ceylanicum]